MTSLDFQLGRREFLGSSSAMAAAMAAGFPLSAAAQSPRERNPICVFIKFIQSLNYEELTNAVADLGFDGIEATVRRGGYIEPNRAADELPKLVEALAKRDLKIMMLTTDVLRADDPTTEPMLRAAVAQGVPMYRMGFYRYDLRKPVLDQLKEIAPAVADVAALNKELGIQAVYQNHCGADMVGGTLWDMYGLIKDIPNEQIGLAFDIRHATIEAGLSWPTIYNAMKSRIATVYAKDFKWTGRTVQHVPFGTGQVDPKFFRQLQADQFSGPISLHVEYVRSGGAPPNIEALRRDLASLKNVLEA